MVTVHNVFIRAMRVHSFEVFKQYWSLQRKYLTLVPSSSLCPATAPRVPCGNHVDWLLHSDDGVLFDDYESDSSDQDSVVDLNVVFTPPVVQRFKPISSIDPLPPPLGRG